ncbi:hypothetical protein SISNIDRAFT_467958 [Sistotremastrum niveocremeum HHB9708]|uniref:H-type lectin domain-containing protein n=1 Tax=Sistotremastrum niveocremeum HHB9708 TaxID=1314777 RepID=A0A164RZQ2_9AGAM|nr:hypothetical protein SISNIDRAFT_467958 [Sistotremastrum niveocremeum HHB9708]
MPVLIDAIETGTWKTPKDWRDVTIAECQQEKISLKYQLSPPIMITGFNLLDIGNHSNGKQIRAYCHASDIGSYTFTLHSDTWADGWLASSVISWLAIPPSTTGILAGTCEVRPMNAPGAHSTHVAFQGAFSYEPKIFLCLNYVDFGGNWRIGTWPENITRTGFDAVFESRGHDEAALYAAGGSWLAYESGKENIKSGNIDVEWVPAGSSQKSGVVYFDQPFRTAPSVFVGLTQIISHTEFNLRISVEVRSVEKDRFDWVMYGWSDSLNFEIGAAWLAFVQE